MDNFSNTKSYTILALGFAKWWGSDPRALSQAFRALGHNVLEIDAEDYVPWRWGGLLPRLMRRIFIWILVRDYNRAVVKQAESSLFDFILVFKGMYLKESTISILRSFGKPVYNFYPDVSFVDHGPYIPQTLSYYDCVFTTKSFHGKKEINLFRIRDLVHTRHGFDPEVHRPIRISQSQLDYYGCDISFVGCWSPKKERLISHILNNRKNYKVVIYGIGWKYASIDFKKALGKNLRPGAFGDELAIIYNSSKVNLGLLSCAASDPNVSDKTTARTFQITAAGSVLLHEDTFEVRTYYQPDKEIMLFSDEQDLLFKLDKLLNDDSLRVEIKSGGYQRCINESYDYSAAANVILNKFKNYDK